MSRACAIVNHFFQYSLVGLILVFYGLARGVGIFSGVAFEA